MSRNFGATRRSASQAILHTFTVAQFAPQAHLRWSDLQSAINSAALDALSTPSK
ncbi:hypothetical protein P3T43_005026 [Paraburkholderia sp. GAS41]|jgi:hypothetical protein|uniref:hypothetical protein n=1 Tax=Paraburkholderia sp. GAS41 TaxID=3035134 RepID=UPI003D1E4DE0